MDAMIDIETLSTRGDAAVLSVGMVLFDENGTEGTDRMHFRMPLDVQLQSLGRRVDASTFFWWLGQSEAARVALSSNDTTQVRVADLYNTLKGYLGDGMKVWARGTNFDLSILESLFRACGFDGTPWKYNAPRDSRTMLDLLPADRLPVRTNTAHNALDDAIYEAECVATAMRYIDTLKYWAPPRSLTPEPV